MTASSLLTLVDGREFRKLFIDHLGWNNPDKPDLRLEAEGRTLTLQQVAGYRGLRIWRCDEVPDRKTQRYWAGGVCAPAGTAPPSTTSTESMAAANQTGCVRRRRATIGAHPAPSAFASRIRLYTLASKDPLKLTSSRLPISVTPVRCSQSKLPEAPPSSWCSTSNVHCGAPPTTVTSPSL